MSKLKTFSVVGGLPVNDIARYRKSLNCFDFDQTLSPDRSQNVKRLHCWHQPLHHIEEEY